MDSDGHISPPTCVTTVSACERKFSLNQAVGPNVWLAGLPPQIPLKWGHIFKMQFKRNWGIAAFPRRVSSPHVKLFR